ncbi:hypothetical protein KM1_131400 [Entamoeba histolytica HM-3:IMSS]|uniref:Uncharacterized protein n=1 Tax=Entamoeba histolytica HM-3:IMSS TaxID=885315 RepID=M7WYZ5_ENTHI|nr:hypothetical protein KM1_131400 [Entamoeba histolytica HM-3:IMSS]
MDIPNNTMNHNPKKSIILSTSSQLETQCYEEHLKCTSCQSTPREKDVTPRDFFVETEIASIIKKVNHVDYISGINGKECCTTIVDMERSCNPPL